MQLAAALAAGALCAAAIPLAARAVAVSDGFPDQSGYWAASGTSDASLDAFDSFVFSRASGTAAIASFSSFVSEDFVSANTLDRFRSDEPAAFIMVVR
ncbi:MAG: hypothetical protein IJP66_07075 [Kiritimatiellae bacterium]|nr:hypothetical protein [Kiritimatiellia bacterium]